MGGGGQTRPMSGRLTGIRDPGFLFYRLRLLRRTSTARRMLVHWNKIPAAKASSPRASALAIVAMRRLRVGWLVQCGLAEKPISADVVSHISSFRIVQSLVATRDDPQHTPISHSGGSFLFYPMALERKGEAEPSTRP